MGSGSGSGSRISKKELIWDRRTEGNGLDFDASRCITDIGRAPCQWLPMAHAID